VLTLLGGGTAAATDIDLVVQAHEFGLSEITVGPGCEVGYRVIVELADGANQGLASLAFDLDYSGGLLAPAVVPVSSPIAAFSPPLGYSNPGGFGGTPSGGDLLQVGGSQNVMMHGQWSCDSDDECPGASNCVSGFCSAIAGLPTGEVIPDLGYPGAPVAVATGTVTVPTAPGVYDISATNPRASVLALGATGRQYWPTREAGTGVLTSLTITVDAGASCAPGPGACCLPSGLCTSALPVDCVQVLGGMTHGSGTLCEGDLDGDGSDGMCGDLCPEDPLKTEPGLCGCGVVDDETDSDGDTVPDCIDQCPGEDDLQDLNGNGIPDCLEQQPGIPTVSSWGLAVFAALLAISASLILGWRRL
jgi:hypothetical protein